MADNNTFVLREVFAKIVAPITGQTHNLTATTRDKEKAELARDRLLGANRELGMLLRYDVTITESGGSYAVQMCIAKDAIFNYPKLWGFVKDNPKGWAGRVNGTDEPHINGRS